MRSAQWKLLKTMKLIEANQQCEVCESKHNLQLHHIVYDRLTHEKLEDLAILCEKKMPITNFIKN